MVLNELLKISIEEQWKHHAGHAVKIKKATPVHGGDINNCFHIVTGAGDFFLKYSKSTVPADFFKKEYDGLKLLAGTGTLSAPRPLFHGSAAAGHFLVTEWIEKSPPRPDFWQVFAGGLAAMHRHSAPHFGLGYDNYIGSLQQANKPDDSWPVFYARRRLEPLVKQCVDRQLLSPRMIRQGEYLYARLPEMFPGEAPALLHGDLWGGNYLPGPEGVPEVFDPAVYYGHREMDLAMTRLFGGFDRTFYWYYEDHFPLSPGWQERIAVCQLYPLLVHALLFGGGYVQRVRDLLSAY